VHPESVQWHPVAQHPQIGVEVHFQVGRELERYWILGNYGRGFVRVMFRPSWIPASNRVLVDKRVEQRAGGTVHGHGGGLHAGETMAQVSVLVDRVRNAAVRL